MIRTDNTNLKKPTLPTYSDLAIGEKKENGGSIRKFKSGKKQRLTNNKTNNQPNPKIFIQNLAPFAIYTQQMTGIPASVTLAQAALESGWGKHAPGNNFFGIKGKGPAGSQSLRTTEVQQGEKIRIHDLFRKYHDPFESFLDHAKVIAQGRYLKHAMEHTGSAEAFVTALQSKKTKYATDPNYVQKIMSIVHKYDLEKYDSQNMVTVAMQPGVES